MSLFMANKSRFTCFSINYKLFVLLEVTRRQIIGIFPHLMCDDDVDIR